MNKAKVILSWSFYSIQEDNKYTNKFNIVAKEWLMEKMLLYLMPWKHYIELTFEFKLMWVVLRRMIPTKGKCPIQTTVTDIIVLRNFQLSNAFKFFKQIYRIRFNFINTFQENRILKLWSSNSQ